MCMYVDVHIVVMDMYIALQCVISYLHCFIYFSLGSVCHSFYFDHCCFHWIDCCNGVSFIDKNVDAQTVHLFYVRMLYAQTFILIVFYYRSSFVVGFVIYYCQYFAAKYLFVSKDGALVDNRYANSMFADFDHKCCYPIGGSFMFSLFSFYSTICWLVSLRLLLVLSYLLF